MLEKLEGTIERITYYSEEDGYTVARFQPEGQSDLVTVVGNLFSGVRPKALTVEGQASKHVLFSDNVLVDTDSDDKKLEASLVKDNLDEE